MRKAYEDLEWQRIAEAVAERCVGPRGGVAELPVASTAEATHRALEETREAWTLLAEDEPLPLSGLREVRPYLARLGRGGMLDGPALRDVVSMLGAARVLRRFLARRKDRVPRLLAACTVDPSLERLETEIGDAIEQDGTLADHASPGLRRLRTEVANLRGRLVARLEAIIEKRADILQERYFTIREGRYVLPVRTDAHERLAGIVHATSSSGATVFVEPSPLVPQGNRLKIAQAEMEREEARILAILSESLRERLAETEAAVDALEHADLRNASAKLGKDLGGSMIALSDAPGVRLVAARHPLLCLEGADVVPNDLELEAGRALVISGPNAGGKTVALKVLGLAALMMRAGLPFPCAQGSRAGFFDPVLTDVGDHQSIAASLSTFSAHVVNLAEVLRRAGPRALVLLDELAGSTDPAEGAALACAVVDALCQAGATVGVTTHYEPLKAFATADERLRNASVGLDVSRMEPTFRLALDVPGASSALAVAGRYGIPEAVLDAARKVLPEQARTFEDLVQKLSEQRRALEEARARVARELEAVRALREEAEAARAQVRERAREALERESDPLVASVREARQELAALKRRMKRAKEPDAEMRGAAEKTLERAAGTLAAAQREVHGDAPPTEPVEVPSTLSPGDRVWVERLRTEAEVVLPPSRGRVRVKAGAMKLWVEEADLRKPVGRPAGKTASSERASRVKVRAARPPSDGNTIDVRGMRVEDALALIETFLDRLYGRDEPVGYVVHGVGSGALRDAIRAHLGADPHYVKSARPGAASEGGERVTVVELR